MIKEPRLQSSEVGVCDINNEKRRKWKLFRRFLAATAISLVLWHGITSTVDARDFAKNAKSNIGDAFAGGQYAASEQYDTVLHWSDPHDNFYSADVIAEIADQANVSTVIDTGDTTYLGLPVENVFAGKILEPFQELGVNYVYVNGNHDSNYTTEYMRNHGATVLNGKVTQVGPYNFIGDCDPSWDNIRPQTEAAESERNERITSNTSVISTTIVESEAEGQYIDFLATHDPELGEAKADNRVIDDVIYHLSGHVHRNSIYRPVTGNDYLFTIDDASGSNRDGRDALFGSGIGRPSNPVSARIFYVERGSEPGKHRVAKVCTVTVHPSSRVEIEETVLG